MKKFCTIILTAALAVTLCGCSNGGESGSNIIPSGASRGDEAFEQYVKTIPDVDFPMPDGTARRREDIDRLNKNGVITFDFAYIRSPEVRFESTFDYPGIFDKENIKFRSEIDTIENIEWVPVKAGDVLENGLVVESAYTMPVYNYPFENDSIVFEGAETVLTFSGELELEGILRIFPGSEYYGYANSSVTFIPDCTKFALPIPFWGNIENRSEEYKTSADPNGGNELIYDGAEFHFGNLEEAGYDFGSDVPAFSKARFKIKNIRSQYDGYNGDILECTILDQ